jgi:hypothetical protein
MSYTIFVQYKKAKAPLLNLSLAKDGSVHLIELISKYAESPEFEIVTYNLPVDKVGTGKTVKPDEKLYSANKRIKFSHHQSGLFQISGENSKEIISGVDTETGQPKGVAVEAFKLKQVTNDGGPFLTANIWGVQHMPNKKSKSSEPIIFTEKEINYQSMNNSGEKHAFVFLFFHFPVSKFSTNDLNKDWFYYDYKHYKKPLLLRLLKEGIKHGYVIGVSCLKARTSFSSDFGYTMSGGAGEIDPKTGTCKNVAVIFPRPEYREPLDLISIDRYEVD